jgi:hypothetical protein
LLELNTFGINQTTFLFYLTRPCSLLGGVFNELTCDIAMHFISRIYKFYIQHSCTNEQIRLRAIVAFAIWETIRHSIALLSVVVWVSSFSRLALTIFILRTHFLGHLLC